MWNEGEEIGERRRSARIVALEEKRGKKNLNLNAIHIIDDGDDCNIQSQQPKINKGKASLIENEAFEPKQSYDGLFSRTSSTSAKAPLLQFKRGLKRKKLEDIVLFSVPLDPPQQDGHNTEKEKSTMKNDQKESESSMVQMPKKQTLEFVLDILQRRDTLEIFAQPVDPEEVETYYMIIKEPMDFGTMRAKLHEGMYTSLEQFEKDIFLISSNAMHFNASNTIYYKEARAIKDLAQRVFRVMKTDPDKLELIFSPTKRKLRRIALSEDTGSNSQLVEPNAAYLKGKLNLNLPSGSIARLSQRSGSRRVRSSTLLDFDKRNTYKPQTAFSSENESKVSPLFNSDPKPLVHIDGEGFGYKESLLQFVKGLGPTAQLVASRKLSKLLELETLNSQYETPNPLDGTLQSLVYAQCTPQHMQQTPIPASYAPQQQARSNFNDIIGLRSQTPTQKSLVFPSQSLASQRPSHLNDVNIGQRTSTSLYLPWPSKFTNLNKGFEINNPASPGRNSYPLISSNNRDRADGRNKAVATESKPKERTRLLGLVAALDITEYQSSLPSVTDQATKEDDRKNALLGNLTEERGKSFDIFGSSKGKEIYNTGNQMEFLHGNIRENRTQQNENNKVSLASHLRVIEVNDLNVPGTSCIHKRYKTINMIPTPGLQLGNQFPQNNFGSLPKINNCSNPPPLPSLAERFPGLSRAFAGSGDFGSEYLASLTSNNKPYYSETSELLDWSQPNSWISQPVNEQLNLPMQLEENPFGQELLQPIAAQGTPSLNADSIIERATSEYLQMGANCQYFQDNQQESLLSIQQPDLALQL